MYFFDSIFIRLSDVKAELGSEKSINHSEYTCSGISTLDRAFSFPRFVVSRRKKEEGRRKKEEGRRKKRYTASLLAIGI
ncbi:MAG: hypothetical protein ABI180_04840 [Microcoleus sp.]